MTQLVDTGEQLLTELIEDSKPIDQETEDYQTLRLCSVDNSQSWVVKLLNLHQMDHQPGHHRNYNHHNHT